MKHVRKLNLATPRVAKGLAAYAYKHGLSDRQMQGLGTCLIRVSRFPEGLVGKRV